MRRRSSHEFFLVMSLPRDNSKGRRLSRLNGGSPHRAASRPKSDGLDVSWVTDAPRWLLLGSFCFAPWAYGGTEPWAVTAITWVVGVSCGLWFLTCLARQRMPDVPRGLAIAGGLLVMLVWWMALNAKFDFDVLQKDFSPREPWLAWAPGSVNHGASVEMAWRVTTWLSALLFVCDLARRSLWRKRVLGAMAFAGLSIVGLGLVQRATGATAIFWGEGELSRSFFATFRYHSNAGAYLNLVWPVVAGFFALSLLRSSRWPARVAWGTALVLCGAGALIIASRAAGVLALLLGGMWVLWLIRQAWQGRIDGVNHTVTGVTVALLILSMVAVGALAGFDVAARRWAKFDREFTLDNPRLQVARACLKMAPEAGGFGLGPGAFQSAFPYFSGGLKANTKGIWEHAHNDYLETVAEYGAVGTSLWSVIILGGIGRASWLAWRNRRRLGTTERVHLLAVLTALGSVLAHAMVDYPLQIASVQIYVAALLGLLWGARHWLDVEPPPDDLARPRSHAPSVAADATKSF